MATLAKTFPPLGKGSHATCIYLTIQPPVRWQSVLETQAAWIFPHIAMPLMWVESGNEA